MEKILKGLSVDDFLNFFELDSTVDWIRSNGFTRVALQFPDNLLCVSARIAWHLEDAMNNAIKTFILADTSYRSCCVDVVAAEQAGAQCILHYGDVCMSVTGGRFPVRYIYGSLFVDTSLLHETVAKHSSEFAQLCVLLYDVMCASLADTISTFLRNSLHKDVVTCDLMDFSAAGIDCLEDQSNKAETCLGRRLSRKIEPEGTTLIFVGDEDSPLLSLWLMANPGYSNVFTISPLTAECSFNKFNTMRALRKRLFLVEKVRDASVIGVLINPLDIADYSSALKQIRKLCTNSGRKFQLLSVGKLNECKLSNFDADIEVFVIISCPYGIILDTSSYHKPVVSLFEANVALNPGNQWFASKGWTAEFKNILNDELQGFSENVDVSLITGKMRSLGRLSSGDENANDKTLDSSSSKRTWTGLQNEQGNQVGLAIENGRRGIALQYSTEPAEHQKSIGEISSHPK